MKQAQKLDWKDLHVAYFSMEIGLDAEIPTYAGGLGVLAGDTLRSAADLELPVVGVTLLYRKGYFTQKITQDGDQIEEDVSWQPEKLLKELPVKVSVRIMGRDVKVRAWLHELLGISGKKNPILFLDTDLPENSDYDRTITHHLYGHDEIYRLSQEAVLGIGGVRILDALGCTGLQKYHMNEGHSALLALELSRKHPLDDVRERCVFTTHTPVPAGHDQFDRVLAESVLGDNIPENMKDIFIDNKLNMTYLGLYFSKYVNGVAKKHGEVARDMFPGYHIESITNGVHSRFWVSDPFSALFDRFIPGWSYDPFSLRYIMGIPKEFVWEAHQRSKEILINYVNGRYNAGMSQDTFTIGFARRAATYKRGDMLFSDIARLVSIAEKYKIQIIFAGKAHPRDTEGKQVIKRIISGMKAVKDRIRVCYVEDYCMESAKMLVAGVDIWLNTPQRPKEASGTSGMKAAHNGVPHFSTLDGWWLEGHIENVTGWSIGSHPCNAKQSTHEEDVDDMYTKLEYVILPKFYNERDSWIEVMRHAIALNGSFFNTHRMIQQYVLNAYFR